MSDEIITVVLTLISLFGGIFTYEYLIDMDRSKWPILVMILSSVVGLFISLILLVVNLKLRESREYALIFKDTLTNAYNRRMLLRLFNKYSKDKKPFSLVYLDINKFKDLNDVNGHIVGDMVLIDFVDRVMNVIKNSDKLIRVDGDEFVLILDGNLSENDIKSIIKRIYSALNDTFSLPNVNVDVSVSAGYSRYPVDAEDLTKLIDIADSNMYKQKCSA